MLLPILASLLCGAALAAPSKPSFQHQHQDPIRLLYQYPLGTWVENIAVRPSGELLLTLLNVPKLDQLNPLQRNASPENVHTFAEATATSGIAEIAPDVFAIAVGMFSLTDGPMNRSFALYKAEFDKPGAEVSKITGLEELIFPNGMCNIPSSSSKQEDVLVGDIRFGKIWRVDTTTGAKTVAVQNNFTAVVPDPVFGMSGVNGVHVSNGTLYFANTGQGILGEVPYPPPSPGAPGSIVTKVLNSSLEFDDFAISRDGEDLFAVTGSGNSIERIGLKDGRHKGRVRIVAGHLNSTQIAEPTSCAFGRTAWDREVLYVVTAGGLAAPVVEGGEEKRVGGQVIAVDTGRWKEIREEGWGWGR